METTMELDELKAAWQSLDRQLQRRSTLDMELHIERKLDRLRSRVRRLYWGKIAQILFGDALIYFGIMVSISQRATPHLLACSLYMLAYGVLTVVFGGVMLGRISGIDHTAPVLDISRRVVALRRAYRVENLCLGLPWWFLWIAIFALEMQAMVGIDLFVRAPAFLWISGGLGVIGFIGTLVWFGRRNARLAADGDASDAPRSLREANRILADIARFEQS
ncbi:MAG: hypothetical protein KF759_10455 [Dokdonella sp.]|nr:hypothetical protein [Dokdonella sp.]